MSKEYRDVGYAYPTSCIARRLGRTDKGCWFHCTLKPDFLSNDDFAGPFANARQADEASKAAFPDLVLPPGTADWLAKMIEHTAPDCGKGLATRMSRRSALVSMCAATVVAVIPGAPAEAADPLIALEANLKELRETGEEAWEVCGAAEDEAALVRAEIPWEAIQDRIGVAEREIWNTSANSPQGVLVKLRETHHQLILTNETEETLESEFAVDLVGDVLGDFERVISSA